MLVYFAIHSCSLYLFAIHLHLIYFAIYSHLIYFAIYSHLPLSLILLFGILCISLYLRIGL